MTIETAVGLLSLLNTGVTLNTILVPFLLVAWLILGGRGRNRRSGPRGVLIAGLVVDLVLLAGALLAPGWREIAAEQAPESSPLLLLVSPLAGLVVLSVLLVRDVRFDRRIQVLEAASPQPRRQKRRRRRK